MTILRASDIPAQEMHLVPVQGLRRQIEAARQGRRRKGSGFLQRLRQARASLARQLPVSPLRCQACP